MPALAQGAGQIAFSYLLDLPGDQVDVRYAPGSLDRAVYLQERFELLVKEFKGWSRGPGHLVVFLFSREDWQQRSFELPYGIPMRAGGQGIALISWADAESVALWRRLYGQRLPTVAGSLSRGTPEEAASLALGDLVATVDAARVLLISAGLSADPPWVVDLVAHLAALEFLARHDPARQIELRQLYANLGTIGGGPQAHPPAAVDDSLPLATRLWLEAQFHVGATLIQRDGGKQPMKEVLKAARKNGGRIDVSWLVGEYPALAEWMRTSFRSP